MILIKLIGWLVIGVVALIALAVYDVGWNGGALFYRLAGRDALVQACTPPLRADLVSRGFSPVDLTFNDAPSIASIAGSFGRSRSLANGFTFTDGAGGLRVDGRMTCVVEGDTVRVDLTVDQLPRRVT